MKKPVKRYLEIAVMLMFAVVVSLMSVQCAGTKGGGDDDGGGKRGAQPGPKLCYDDPEDAANRCDDPSDQND